MISMLTQANATLRLGRTSSFKFVWVSDALDGCENYLVSEDLLVWLD